MITKDEAEQIRPACKMLIDYLPDDEIIDILERLSDKASIYMLLDRKRRISQTAIPITDDVLG